MTRALALLPFAMLAACTRPQPYPQPMPMPQGPYGMPAPIPADPEIRYRATGTEPFWDLTIGRDLIFTDRGNNVQVIQPTPAPQNGVAGESYFTPRLRVNVVHAPCSDGMSDRTYPDQVSVAVDGRAYRGCGAAPAFFASPSAGNGDPLSPGAPVMGDGRVYPAADTAWRVTRIDGRPVPPTRYTVSFTADRFSGQFGCNTLGAGYAQNGDMLTMGALVSTRMACPYMGDETAAAAILAQPVRFTATGKAMVLTNTVGTIELARTR